MSLKYLSLLYFILFTPTAGHGNIDSLFQVLDNMIEQREELRQQKHRAIYALKKQLNDEQIDSFTTYYQLCQAYQSFNYDTAFAMVQLLKQVAQRPAEKAQANIQEAFILLSAGLFREAIDILQKTDISAISNDKKAFYFYNLARSHFDLADFYNDDFQQANTTEKGQSYLDSAIAYAKNFPLQSLSYQGLKAYKNGDKKNGVSIYKQLINQPDITNRQLAVEYSTLSSFYYGINNDSLVYFILKAAIADEKSLVKESIALLHLAKYISDEQQFERASRYINLALKDANFFGARHRKIQILGVLPIIESQRLALEKSKRQQFIVFSTILSISLIITVILLIRVLKQKEFIKRQNNQITLQNADLKNKEATISNAYQRLESYAQQLIEAEKLKEQYIGFFFQSNTQLINKVQLLLKQSQKQIAEGKFKEAIFTLKQFSPKHQKKKLLTDFDVVFLTVFPTFIQQINLLFPEKEQYKIPKNNTLNTELRIFALIRLGIRNNDTIAKILNYSVNTIYTYKTKVRNKSILDSDDFDKAIMEIQSVLEG